MMRKSISLSWRRIPERYRLLGCKCVNCSTTYFPTRQICPKCRRKGKLESMNFSGEGEVYSYTLISAPPIGFERQVPYVLAIVKLKEGAKINAQIVDVKIDDVKIGFPVERVFRIIQKDDPEGLIHYGTKFKLKK